jgi:tripartite-type tricarboxylate transporter receptor subunit TctC
MYLTRRGFGALAPATALAALLPTDLLAQAAGGWLPSHPIRFVISGGPGSGSDMTGRLVANQLTTTLRQPFILENQAGAGGTMATDVSAKSAPDGMTWTLLSSAAATQAAIMKQLPFDTVKDLAFVSTLSVYPIVLSVAMDSPIKDFADFIRRAKAEPGKMTYSSVGIGSAYHFVGELVAGESGTEILHVPFRSGAGPLVEVLSGRVDVMIDSAAATSVQVKGGKMRALAVTSPARSDQFPGVPTLSEFYPGLQYESWLAIACAARTPPEIVTRINQEVKLVLEDPKIAGRMQEQGQRATWSTPEETRARMERDIARFRGIVASRHIERQ